MGVLTVAAMSLAERRSVGWVGHPVSSGNLTADSNFIFHLLPSIVQAYTLVTRQISCKSVFSEVASYLKRLYFSNVMWSHLFSMRRA